MVSGLGGAGRLQGLDILVGVGGLGHNPLPPGSTSPADVSRKEKMRRSHIVEEGPGLC